MRKLTVLAVIITLIVVIFHSCGKDDMADQVVVLGGAVEFQKELGLEGLDLDLETQGSANKAGISPVKTASGTFLTGGINYDTLPDFNELTLTTRDYKPRTVKEGLQLRELAIEICSRPEINIRPEYLLGTLYMESNFNFQWKYGIDDVSRDLSLINENKSTQYKGPAQLNEGNLRDKFGGGYISKLEDPTLAEEARVFKTGDSGNTNFNPQEYQRPSAYYLSDAMYYMAFRLSRTYQGFSQHSTLSSPSGRIEDGIKNARNTLGDDSELTFLLAAHVYNGVRLQTIYDITMPFYKEAKGNLGALSSYSTTGFTSRSNYTELMVGNPRGTFSLSGQGKYFDETMAEDVSSRYLGAMKSDYNLKLNKDPYEFWSYSVPALNLGTSIFESLEKIYSQTLDLQVNDLQFLWPLPGYTRISSPFAGRYHPLYGYWEEHNGVDIPAPEGTPVIAMSGGVVTSSRLSDSWGNVIEIDHGEGMATLYAHASKRLVKTGDTVQAGQIISEVGNTGWSTNNHLHFTIYLHGKAVDPNNYVTPQ